VTNLCTGVGVHDVIASAISVIMFGRGCRDDAIVLRKMHNPTAWASRYFGLRG